MTYWEIYLFTRLDNINVIAVLISIVGSVTLTVFAVFSAVEEDFSSFKKYYLKPAIVVILSIFISIAAPTQKEAAAIWLVPKIVNNEKIQGIAQDSLQILELHLGKYLNDLRGKGEKK